MLAWLPNSFLLPRAQNGFTVTEHGLQHGLRELLPLQVSKQK